MGWGWVLGFGVRVAWRLGLGCSVTPFETAVSKVSAGWLGVGAGVGVGVGAGEGARVEQG